MIQDQISNPDYPSDWDQQALKDKEARKSLRAENRGCPVCFETGIIPLGGMTSCWWEHNCGAYSALARSWEEAFLNLDGWKVVDEEDNARMYPHIGMA